MTAWNMGPWTAEDDEILIFAIERGYPARDTMIVLDDRTFDAIRARMTVLRRHLEIPPRYRDGNPMLHPDDPGYLGTREKLWKEHCKAASATMVKVLAEYEQRRAA